MKKLLTFILSITLSIAAWSQDEKICPVGEFHSVVAGSTMELALQESSQPSVKIIADKALMPYIQVYVRSRVLYVDMDEKSIPSDVRKLYKGKNAPVPVTRVLVSAPSLFKVSGTGNAHQLWGSCGRYAHTLRQIRRAGHPPAGTVSPGHHGPECTGQPFLQRRGHLAGAQRKRRLHPLRRNRDALFPQ